MTNRLKIICLVQVFCFLLPLFVSAQAAKPKTFTDGGKKYTYTDSGGITSSFVSYFGSKFKVDSIMTPGGESLVLDDEPFVTVYNFWFVACKPCVAEIPALNQLAVKYKNDSVRFIAVTFDNPERVIKFLQTTPFDFMIGIIPQDAIGRIKKISYYPFTAIVNKKQKLSYVVSGRPMGKNPEKEIFELLDPQIRKALTQ